MYVAPSSEPLPSLFKSCRWGPKKAPPGRSCMFYIDLYKEKLRFYILLILSTLLMETFPCKVLMILTHSSYRTLRGAMFSYAFIKGHSQVHNSGPECPLVLIL